MTLYTFQWTLYHKILRFPTFSNFNICLSTLSKNIAANVAFKFVKYQSIDQLFSDHLLSAVHLYALHILFSSANLMNQIEPSIAEMILGNRVVFFFGLWCLATVNNISVISWQWDFELTIVMVIVTDYVGSCTTSAYRHEWSMSGNVQNVLASSLNSKKATMMRDERS